MILGDRSKGWIGFDLDATLAHYDEWKGVTYIGKPIPKMLDRLKRHLEKGDEVRIFTARVWPLGTDEAIQTREHVQRMIEAKRARTAIRRWSKEHIGRHLPITCVKDPNMKTLYDDRARQVEANTGKVVGE